MAQIKKARGQNKWVNQPKTSNPPTKEEFCYVIPAERLRQTDGNPCRPMSLPLTNWNLAEYHAARLEHAPNMFRLYYYGPDARGVFRGDVLVCESIPESDESARFAGLLLFNEQGWKKSLAVQPLTLSSAWASWRSIQSDSPNLCPSSVASFTLVDASDRKPCHVIAAPGVSALWSALRSLSKRSKVLDTQRQDRKSVV